MIPVSAPTASAAPAPYRDPTRHLDSVLATLERRTLLWLAGRMPRFVHSDHLTALALVAMAGVGLSYWWAATNPLGLVAASVCLAINWFGDSLDGTLARVRGCPRPRYGYYVDHVIDELGIAFLFGGLALSGYMTPWVAAAVLVAYFMLCIEVYLATHVLDTFRMTFFKMGPTELRILLAIGNTVALVRPMVSPFGEPVLLFDIGGIVGAAGLALTLVFSAIGNTRTLYRLEPRAAGRP
jgi:phosphatidylglycerophosphate synthase